MKSLALYITEHLFTEAKQAYERLDMSLDEYCADKANLKLDDDTLVKLTGMKAPRDDEDATVLMVHSMEYGIEQAKKEIKGDPYETVFIAVPLSNCNIVLEMKFRNGKLNDNGLFIVGPKEVNIKSCVIIARSAYEFYKDLYSNEEDLYDKIFNALNELKDKASAKFSASKEDMSLPSKDVSPYRLSKRKRFPDWVQYAEVKADGKDFIYKNTWNGSADIFVQTVKDGKTPYYKVLMGDSDSSFENGNDFTAVYYLKSLGQLDKFLEFTLKPNRRKQHAELGADGEIHVWSSAMKKHLPKELQRDIIKDEALIKKLDFKHMDIYDFYK